jgi:hypothetical protein
MTHAHLSDEQLSAYLDGEPGDEASDASPDRTPDVEITGCDTCRHRLAALTAARDLVRQPVAPVSSTVRTAAVASALADGLGHEAGAGTGTVLPLKRPFRLSPALLGAAAAVLLVVVGVSLGISHRQNGGPVASSAAPALRHSPPARGASVPDAAPAVALPDLGSIASTSALRSRVATALTPTTDQQKALGNGSDFESLPAPTAAGVTGAPANAKSGTTNSATTAVSVPAATQTCVSAAERAAGTTATPQLVATATYEHTPAFVVVVHTTSPSSTSGSTTAVVVARTGCRVLARTTV